MHRHIFGAASAALLLAMAAAAIAAPAKTTAPAPAAAKPAAAPQPAPPPINHGPPLANVCIYNDDRAIGVSTVGKAAATRMQQLRAQVTAELQAEQTTLQTDISAFNAKRPTLTPEQLAAQGQPLQQREQAFEAKAGQRQRELEATGQEALGQIHKQIDGILRTVYQAHGCSLLLRGEAVYIANPKMDVTEDVVVQLNAILPTITFDRKLLPAQP
jgi:outer membrane protein